MMPQMNEVNEPTFRILASQSTLGALKYMGYFSKARSDQSSLDLTVLY